MVDEINDNNVPASPVPASPVTKEIHCKYCSQSVIWNGKGREPIMCKNPECKKKYGAEYRAARKQGKQEKQEVKADVGTDAPSA